MVASSSKLPNVRLQATALAQSAKRIAVVFPGQGSQSVGMLIELAEEYSVIEQTFTEASQALGFDLWAICHDEEQLALTEYTQPAILTASIAIWRILQEEIFHCSDMQKTKSNSSLGTSQTKNDDVDFYDELDKQEGASAVKRINTGSGHENNLGNTDRDKLNISGLNNLDDDLNEAIDTVNVPQIIYMAGHSLGEYSALCAAGVVRFKDAVKIVHERGKLMQQAVDGLEIKMAAILGLEDSQVISICDRVRDTTAGAVVSAANFNSPNQVVVAGNVLGVETVMQQVNMLGKKSIPLKVSVPSHCALMQPACQSLSEILKNTKFSLPDIPVIQNRYARTEDSIDVIKTALTEQLCLPVLWSQTMQFMADKHINMIIECGPGTVLSNLAKRQDTPITSYPTDKPARIQKLLEALA